MSQKIILGKFVAYLEIACAENIAELNAQKQALTDPQAIDAFNQFISEQEKFIQDYKAGFKAGHCFGFSVSHGAMDYIGKLNWWEHALTELNNWNGLIDSLDEEIIIPDSTDNKPTTRRKLFDLALSFIVHIQAVPRDGVAVQEFLLNKINQSDIFQSFSSHLEVIDNNNEVQTIKSSEKISGYFTEENLKSVMMEENFNNAMCIIGSSEHAMRLKYMGDNQWMLYDPNYSHETIKSMHLIGDKDVVVNAIFRRLKTHAIGMTFASFDYEKKFDLSAYNNIMKNSPESLLMKQGLQRLIEYKPVNSIQLFQMAYNGNKKIEKVIINSLAEHDVESRGFHYIANKFSIFLSTLFKWADKNESLQLAIAKGLVAKPLNKSSVLMDAIIINEFFKKLLQRAESKKDLEIISVIEKIVVERPDVAIHSSNNFHTLLELAEKYASIRSAIAKSFSIELTGKYTWVSYMVGSNSLSKLLDLADDTDQGLALRSAIADILLQKSQDGRTGMDVIANAEPSSLLRIFKIADDRIQSAIAQCLTEALVDKNYTWFSFLSINKLLPILFQMAENNSEMKSVLAHIIIQKNNNRGSGIQFLMQYSLDDLPDLLSLIDDSPQGKELQSAIATSLANQNRDNQTGLDYVIQRSSKSIKLIIDTVLENNSASVPDILKAFSTINSQGMTGWQMIDKHAVSSFQKEEILNSLLAVIGGMDSDSLIDIGSSVSEALADHNSVYRGLCKERDAFFRSNYGKTNIWQKLIEKIQETLKARGDYQRDDKTEKLLNISTSRWS